MEIFEQQLELLKVKLKYTLIELGGRATLRQFGYNFRKNYGIVNLQVKDSFLNIFKFLQLRA